MGIEHQVDTPLALAARAVGSQTRLAEIAGKSQGTVNLRLRNKQSVWPEAVLPIEAATGISRHVLRPDIYPLPEPTDAPCPPENNGDPSSVGPSGSIVACDRAALSHQDGAK
ncbi:transcriptional regulator [Sphingomonas abaci]|uniref:Uncharacterized protein n=1 Tax=Sphingomonas abaci TaxID=237611 RepID=A0A7W7EXR2_9SPHN|nr:YdaS family helix-turn-helix protein [Sphingomonas abaci]MBB4617988.1 hypothetical protein [Sphingomonas abaci]